MKWEPSWKLDRISSWVSIVVSRDANGVILLLDVTACSSFIMTTTKGAVTALFALCCARQRKKTFSISSGVMMKVTNSTSFWAQAFSLLRRAFNPPTTLPSIERETILSFLGERHFLILSAPSNLKRTKKCVALKDPLKDFWYLLHHFTWHQRLARQQKLYCFPNLQCKAQKKGFWFSATKVGLAITPKRLGEKH